MEGLCCFYQPRSVGVDVGRDVGGVVFVIGPVSNARNGRLILGLLSRGVSGRECA